ncbi:MAG: hypothetical protein WD267_10740 [Balneolales bacterium]
MARRKTVNYNIMFAAAMILIIITAIWGYMIMVDDNSDSGNYELSSEFYEGSDSIADDLLSYSQKGHSRSEINENLAENFELLIHQEDINADVWMEYVVTQKDPSLPEPHRSLSEDGYDQVIKGMIIYRQADQNLIPVFTLTPEAMRNENGDLLLSQVEAKHGYAFQMYDYEDQDVYHQTVKAFNITLLDEQGLPISDDITIYWDPVLNRYRATNTFGAPGTYSE